MPHAVDYARQTIEHPNPLARLAHRSRADAALALAGEHTPKHAFLLDIGAGTGTFLHRLGRIRPDLDRVAYEPFMALRYPDIVHRDSLQRIPDDSVDTACAFEVLEHLGEAELDDVIAQTRRLLKPGGRFIISVPIMEGLALPMKEASRALLFRRRSDYGWTELLNGMIGRPVPRTEDRLRSHKGFAFRHVETRLATDFRLLTHRHSPFPALPWWVNSQRFAVFAPR